LDAPTVLKKLLFNITFYPLFIALTVGMFAVLLVPMAILRVLAGERATRRLLRWIIRGYGLMVVRGLTFPFVKIECQKLGSVENGRACVYVCNHRAASDAFLMALLDCELVQVVNNWPFRIPIFGWVAERAGYLSIKAMPFEDFLSQALGLLKQGVSLVAFPEGSRSTDRVMRQFNGAVFRVAQAARVPVVPVCISGNERIPEKSSNIFNPGTIRVHQLPALEWESFKDVSPFKFKNQVREMMQAEFERIQAL